MGAAKVLVASQLLYISRMLCSVESQDCGAYVVVVVAESGDSGGGQSAHKFALLSPCNLGAEDWQVDGEGGDSGGSIWDVLWIVSNYDCSLFRMLCLVVAAAAASVCRGGISCVMGCIISSPVILSQQLEQVREGSDLGSWKWRRHLDKWLVVQWLASLVLWMSG